MPAEQPMSVVLGWHMHQPEYRDLRSGRVHLPWTYLHATKDYVDMAAHLEAVPEARAVVNFAPILLEQIEDYASQVRSYLEGHGVIKDPLLAELAEPALPGNDQARLRLMQDCLRANRERMIARFEPFQRLATMAEWYEAHPATLVYASNQFLADLLVWYHISWMAESLQRNDARIQRLRDKAHNFSLHDRRELLQIVLEQLQSIVPRYRALAERGQVELSMSPYAHPIVPLLLDMESAREAMPGVHLPVVTQYPGGEARVRWHLQQGLATFERVFGRKPAGLWPSEGGVSQEALALFGEYGFRWVASGGNVLNNSHDTTSRACSHRVYRFGDVAVDCIFRDDGLSDLIGFNYSDWHANDAVANLIGHMENIAKVCPDRNDCLIAVFLDGENAWEYYPENGYYFLDQLYRDLAEHPGLQLTTFEQFLKDKSPNPAHESHLKAGSWVYGTFSTWIGDPDKNRGWEILVEAKHTFDEQIAAGRLSADEVRAAELQLAICEGSDWFWWFGDYNPSATVNQFDQLFRMHLANLYQMLHVEAPPYLAEVISRGGGQPSRGGVMRQHSESSS
ncbi:MAG: glycoside hydrolase family 57 protein [Gammaproteobacteria bacterium]|nr:glycoside hydrolase family 57 protein [Gammaproteobacteria bacterium]